MKPQKHQPMLAGFDSVEDRVDAPHPPAHQLPEEQLATQQLAPQQLAPAPAVTGAASSTSNSPQSNTPSLTIVVDAHALIYQMFHAMPPMTSPQGLPVGALHGFLRDLADMQLRYRPDYLFCAFDLSEDTFRNELYSEYKAHRDPMPDDLRTQMPMIREALAALGIVALEIIGFEADDIIATVAHQVEQRNERCFIVSPDKDCRQLLSDQVTVLNVRKGEFFGAEQLRETWGVRPDQVVDYQAMVGDSVDNVPGIPLVGPKLAQQLLEQFDTLDSVLENADKIAGAKRRENIVKFRDQALLSRELVRLRRDVPIEIPWERGRPGQANKKQLADLFQHWGFRRLADRFLTNSEQFSANTASQDGATQDATTQQGSSNASGLDAVPWVANYQVVDTVEKLNELVANLSASAIISFDTETTSTNPRWADPVGYSFCWKEGEAVYIPLHAPPGEPTLPIELVNDSIRPILENPEIKKIGQNLKYDLIVLRSQGIRVQGIYCDTMVADYLIDPGQRNHNMDDLSKRYLDHETIKISELIGSGRNQKRMDEVPLSQIVPYAAEDADVPFRLAPILIEKLELCGVLSLFHEMEMPLVEVLAELEYQGIHVDIQRLKQLSDRFTIRIERLLKEIAEMAGDGFNPDSPKQLAKVLFEELKLPIIKKTKTGASTDVEVLMELAPMHPLPAKIIEYRQATKLKSTYIDALPELVCPKTGRVHTSFRQDVAATGRLSSSEPNLQNIPIRTEEGREIRSAFRANPDTWTLLTADYSQIELRVLAHYCGDASLQSAFANDEDIHRIVASEVYGVSQDDVTSAMRRSAKAINFGIIYGQSPFGLAKSLQIGKDEAAAFIDAYFAKYPGVQQFMLDTLTICRKQGYVSTMLGRRRFLQGVRDLAAMPPEKRRTLTEPERMAVNTVIQGSAADLIKMAMIRVHQRLAASNIPARMLLQIHDELVFEVDPEYRQSLGELVVESMTQVCPLKVPLKVDVKTGPSWADCEPI